MFALIAALVLMAGPDAATRAPVLQGEALEACRAKSNRVASCRLELLLAQLQSTTRAPSKVEARFELTQAYVFFEFAWAFARLGKRQRAMDLLAVSSSMLEAEQSEQRDRVHSWLVRTYEERINEALTSGIPRATPPPTGLESLEQYKIERLRGASRAIEPWQRVDAISSFWQRTKSDAAPRPELLELSKTTDSVELAKQVRAMVGKGLDAQQLEAVVGVLPSLKPKDVSAALVALPDAVAALDDEQQLGALTDALVLATALGESEAAAALTKALDVRLAKATPAMIKPVTTAAFAVNRASKRFGLAGATERMSVLSALQKSYDCPERSPCGFLIALALAQQQLLSGADEGGVAVARVMGLMGRTKLVPGDRAVIVRALGEAIGAAPPQKQVALTNAFVRDQFPATTDSYNTNTHFCLSVVGFVDALVVPLVAGVQRESQ